MNPCKNHITKVHLFLNLKYSKNSYHCLTADKPTNCFSSPFSWTGRIFSSLHWIRIFFTKKELCYLYQISFLWKEDFWNLENIFVFICTHPSFQETIHWSQYSTENCSPVIYSFKAPQLISRTWKVSVEWKRITRG